MKKYVLLISLLALTACGGGSGGGHHNSSVPFAPGGDAVRAAVTQEVIDSNKKITSMASEILIPQGGAGDTLVRSGTTSINGQIYKSYRLDDVTFKMGGEDSRLIFELDKNTGEIIALAKYDRSDDFTGDPEYALSEEGVFTRKSGSSEFTKTLYVYGMSKDNFDFKTGVDGIVSEHFDDIDFVNDKGDLTPEQIKAAFKAKLRREINQIKASQSKEDPNYAANQKKFEDAYDIYVARIDAMKTSDTVQVEDVNAVLNIQSVNSGLRYSDLGFAELIVTDSANTKTMEHSYTPYVGGYDEAVKIKQADLAGDTLFTGTAIAGIDHKKKGYGEGNVEEGMLVRQDDARLTMRKDGTATLVMDNLISTSDNPEDLRGKRWYDVQVDIAANGSPTFHITGNSQEDRFKLPSFKDAEGAINQTVEFTKDKWRAHEQEYVINNGSGEGGEGTRFGGVAEAHVYGTNADDMEATARFGFSNEVYSENNTKHEEVAIYGAFGGKH